MALVPEENVESGSEEGMVTVETALGLGSVVLVLALVLTALGVANSKAALCDQIRQEARAYSVGSTVGSLASGTLSASDNGSVFTITGTRPAVSIGEWKLGSVHCEVSGIKESSMPWALLTGEQ